MKVPILFILPTCYLEKKDIYFKDRTSTHFWVSNDKTKDILTIIVHIVWTFKPQLKIYKVELLKILIKDRPAQLKYLILLMK